MSPSETLPVTTAIAGSCPLRHKNKSSQHSTYRRHPNRPDQPSTMISHIRTRYSVFWNALPPNGPRARDVRHPPHTARTESPNFVAQPAQKKAAPFTTGAAFVPTRRSEHKRRLLCVGRFAVQERHFQILIYVQLLRAQIHDLVRLAQNAYHLIRRHSHLHGSRWRCWCRWRCRRGSRSFLLLRRALIRARCLC